MNKVLIASILVGSLVLSSCARLEQEGGASLARLPQETPNVTTAQAISLTDISAFIGADVAKLLSQKERDEAVSAQFYALQFGRPGVFRNWQGETGANGKVTVGPYVRVNTLDCRQFENIVTISDEVYERQGTACREQDGSWSVV